MRPNANDGRKIGSKEIPTKSDDFDYGHTAIGVRTYPEKKQRALTRRSVV